MRPVCEVCAVPHHRVRWQGFRGHQSQWNARCGLHSRRFRPSLRYTTLGDASDSGRQPRGSASKSLESTIAARLVICFTTIACTLPSPSQLHHARQPCDSSAVHLVVRSICQSANRSNRSTGQSFTRSIGHSANRSLGQIGQSAEFTPFSLTSRHISAVSSRLRSPLPTHISSTAYHSHASTTHTLMCAHPCPEVW